MAPSILDSDLADIAGTVSRLTDAGVRVVHLDVMDGAFVPNISFGIPVIASLRQHTDAFLDAHLMIDRPERYVDRFVEAGADCITVHPEATPHVHRALQRIREHGVMAGLSLNPGTPLNFAVELLDTVDLVLLMSVNPGYGGQDFIESTIQRIRDMRSAIDRSGRPVVLEVDGGIKPTNAGQVIDAGADWLVAGSAVVGHAGGLEAGVQSFYEVIRSSAR